MRKRELFISQTKKSPYQRQPEQLGLYDAANEHDACGVGMLVNIHGEKSHDIVESALKVLENMRHRGAEGADNKTGDGAGILLQIPHEFILLQGIPVPEKGRYGTGLLFLPKNTKAQADILSIIIEEIEKEGLTLMHLRNVPTCSEISGIYHRIHRNGNSRPEIIYNKEKDRKPDNEINNLRERRFLYRFALNQKHYI